jgi:hypothetical protein
MVCKLFFSTYALAVNGFINLKLGTRAFYLKVLCIPKKAHVKMINAHTAIG